MILVVAGATFREAVRSRAFLGLLAVYLVCALLTRVVGWISATDGHVVAMDLVLSLQSVIGVLVAVESEATGDELDAFAKKLAQHIAAAGPIALSEADVPAERMARERAVAIEQVKEDPKLAGKPQNVIDGAVNGKVRKASGGNAASASEVRALNPPLASRSNFKPSALPLSISGRKAALA